jgi:hypothetical protein
MKRLRYPIRHLIIPVVLRNVKIFTVVQENTRCDFDFGGNLTTGFDEPTVETIILNRATNR